MPTRLFPRVAPLCLTAILMLALECAFIPIGAIAAPEPLLTCSSEPTDMAITIGDVVECSIDPAGDSDIFRFQGTAGTVILLTLRDLTYGGTSGYCQDGCPTAELYEPGSVTPFKTLPPGTNELKLELAASGTYTLIVTEYGNNQIQSYRVALERLFPTSPTATPLCFGCVISNETINPAPDRDFYVINATEGATLSLTLTDLTYGGTSGYCQDARCPKAEIFDPNRQLIDTLGPGTDSTTLTTLSSGAYLVHVFEDGLNIDEGYNLGLQCLFPPAGRSACDQDTPIPSCKGKPATIIGSEGDDVLYGTAESDVIVGLGGNDIIYGLSGRDFICGGAGDDILNGDEGRDYLDGGPGNDILAGGDDGDKLFGGAGIDNLSGGTGNDRLEGQGGSDICDGGGDAGDSFSRTCDFVVGLSRE